MHSFQEYLAQGHAWLFIPAAIVLGALHGLEPGHSKTMMAAFIVAIRGTVAQAVLLGVAATISHTAIIWVLALVGLHYAGHLNVEHTEPYFQLAAGLIVIGMAGWMYARTRREQRAVAAEAAHHHEHGHEEDQGPRGVHGGPLVSTGLNERVEVSVFETNVPPRFRLFFYDNGQRPMAPPAGQMVKVQTVRPEGERQVFEFEARENYLESTAHIPEPHEFQVALQMGDGGSPVTYWTRFVEDHHHHDHEHASLGSHEPVSRGYQDAHQREHALELRKRFAAGQVTTGQLVLFGLTGGLLPCPSAFAVLVVCLQLKQFSLGFALVLAFSVGLAITLVTVGSIAALSVRQASKRFKRFTEFARKMPYVSATVMVLIGVLIAGQGLRGIMR